MHLLLFFFYFLISTKRKCISNYISAYVCVSSPLKRDSTGDKLTDTSSKTVSATKSQIKVQFKEFKFMYIPVFSQHEFKGKVSRSSKVIYVLNAFIVSLNSLEYNLSKDLLWGPMLFLTLFRGFSSCWALTILLPYTIFFSFKTVTNFSLKR